MQCRDLNGFTVASAIWWNPPFSVMKGWKVLSTTSAANCKFDGGKVYVSLSPIEQQIAKAALNNSEPWNKPFIFWQLSLFILITLWATVNTMSQRPGRHRWLLTNESKQNFFVGSCEPSICTTRFELKYEAKSLGDLSDLWCSLVLLRWIRWNIMV